MGGIEDSIDHKLKCITSCLSPNIFMWWMMAMNHNLLLCLKTCILWFATLFPKFIVLAVPPRRGNIWVHIPNNMEKINTLWKNITWLCIQAFCVGGKMLIQFMLQRSNVRKNPKIDLVLVMGLSQIILGMLIFIKKMMHNIRNSWRTSCCLLPKLTCVFLLWNVSEKKHLF